MALNKTQRDNLRRLGIPDRDHTYYDLDPDNDGRDEEYEYDDMDGEDTEYLEDEDADADGAQDIEHLPARQKPSKAEKRDRRLMEATRRLARQEGITFDELVKTATFGTVQAQVQAAARIEDLQRRAARLVESEREPVQTLTYDDVSVETAVRYFAEEYGLDLDELRRQASSGRRDDEMAAAASLQVLTQRARRFFAEQGARYMR